METKQSMKQPFFAKFLEGQKTADPAEKNEAGESNGIFTHPIKDILVTLKYPSDWDEF